MKALFVYRFCGLGGVETSVLQKVAALQTAGVDARAVFCEYYGTGGSSIAAHDAVVLAEDGNTFDAAIQGFDLISVIDYPEIVERVARANPTGTLVFETHASYLPAVKHFYTAIHHPAVRAIVVPSMFNRRLIEQLAPTPKPIVVIPNPIDATAFSPHVVVDRCTALDARWPTVLWIGRLEVQKNPADCVLIANTLLEQRDAVHFMLIGDDPDYCNVRADLESLLVPSIRARVGFRRSIPYQEMPALYAAVAARGGCLLSTSRHESQPMILLEAMAAGCPVLAPRVGGIAELIEDRVNGRLYEPGDTAAAAAILAELTASSDRGSRRRLADNARTTVHRRHSPIAVGRMYLDLYRVHRRIG